MDFSSSRIREEVERLDYFVQRVGGARRVYYHQEHQRLIGYSFSSEDREDELLITWHLNSFVTLLPSYLILLDIRIRRQTPYKLQLLACNLEAPVTGDHDSQRLTLSPLA